MSLPMLFNGGAECGPSNPLQGLSKRFDQDRGIQQDHFGVSRASSSRDAFRTQPGPSGPDTDVTQFFGPSTSSSSTPNFAMGRSTPGQQQQQQQQQLLSAAFDVSALRAALPPQVAASASVQTPQQIRPPHVNANAEWAVDFMNMNTANSDFGLAKHQHQQRHPQHGKQVELSASSGSLAQPGTMDTRTPGLVVQSPPPLIQNWNPMGFGMREFIPQSLVQQQQQQVSGSSIGDQISWDKVFSAQELQLATSLPEHTSTVIQPQRIIEEVADRSQLEGDELSRTAGMLIENLRHETNPKFQKSQFMNLMRQLRDGEVVVEGNQMVENDGKVRIDTLNNNTVVGKTDKGKMREVVPDSGNLLSTPVTGQVQFQHVPQERQLGEESSREGEDANDAYFRQENADYSRYWRDFEERMEPASTLVANAQEQEWDALQRDWDRFEATSTGIKKQNNYRFQDDNPYLLGDSSRTRHHVLHGGVSPALESVLELEAAVQRDMTNARGWYELGIKQQENERENKALQALERAVELDPTHLPSWLALAISYTNDNNRRGTYDAVEEWVKQNERYAHIPFSTAGSADLTIHERYSRLVDQLIAMARSDINGEIDADTQIALAVLLNTNEDYQKAQDCFKTALAVRPEDWLLYNRVGATMANSGHAGDALQYYHKALELNPGYIRARFNLGISCINLRRYDEAAQYILDALILQDSDGSKDTAGGRGVTSTALWDSLKTACLHMHRNDLATICDAKDLESFRAGFQESKVLV